EMATQKFKMKRQYDLAVDSEGKIIESLSSLQNGSFITVVHNSKLIAKKFQVTLVKAGEDISKGKIKQINNLDIDFGIFLKQVSNKVGIKGKRLVRMNGTEVTKMEDLYMDD